MCCDPLRTRGARRVDDHHAHRRWGTESDLFEEPLDDRAHRLPVREVVVEPHVMPPVTEQRDGSLYITRVRGVEGEGANVVDHEHTLVDGRTPNRGLTPRCHGVSAHPASASARRAPTTNRARVLPSG